jgi:hypothetical protein
MIQKYWMVGAIVMAALTPSDGAARGRPVVDVPPHALQIATVEQIDRAIAASVSEWPRHRMLRYPEERRHMAEMISDATIYTDVSPLLLVAMIKRESSFDENALGKLGERGLTQMKGVAARGCDLTKPEGQLACSVRLLTQVHQRCGTWKGALTVYATRAGTCKSEHPTVQTAVERRLRDWERWSQAALRMEAPTVAVREPEPATVPQTQPRQVFKPVRRRATVARSAVVRNEIARNTPLGWYAFTRYNGAAL